ncbi:MAG: TonB-dependent receptor [Candidatus Eremiobacteraeota bacterium]|nr:TonB-dependent receptor [Candidatus Eremiobacteraeota bacterium]
MPSRSLRRIRLRAALIALGCCAGLIIGRQPVGAGTTGGINGRITDASTAAPLAGVRVDMTSPSGAARSTSDVRGLYSFVSLSPDTYTVTASREGYVTFVQSGVTIQADVQQSLNIPLVASAKTLARVITRPRSGLVRPGQTIDLYSINSNVAQAVQPLAGPGSIDQSYGALAAVPGIYVPQGQQGWYQPIFIRGGDQDQIGYELDGVPVNRSYDNAPQSLFSSIGQQELQVYTGGATASSDGQGISGYLNQVIKTGSRTPFGSLHASVGFPADYHQGSIEYGASLGDGRFTYYLAASLADQAYRYVDPFNGTSLNQSGFFFPSFQFGASGPIDLPGTTLGASETRDRETIVNLHYAIGRGDSPSDDLQLLHMESDLHTFTYGSFNDFGGTATFGNIFGYPDQFVYTGPVGAPLNPSLVGQYIFPSSPDAGRSFQSQVSGDRRALADNGFSLTKLQYQHNIGTRSYVRLAAFNTYSNWFIQDPIPVPATLQYILPEVTFGGVLTYVNQLSDKHLLTLSGSIASSKEYRYTTGFDFLLGGGTTINGTIGGNFLGSVLVGSLTDGTHCYDTATGAYVSCFAPPFGGPSSQIFMDVNTGALTSPSPPAGSPAALNRAQAITTENGYGGLLNQVSPVLSAGALSDRFRPNDALTIEVGARVERYYDRLVDEDAGYPARQFWFNAANNEYCVSATNLSTQLRSIDPVTGAASPCPAGSNPVVITLANANAESNSVFEPRLAATYELSPDTTLRASYGTYARPPNASWVQYGTLQQDLATPLVQKFIAYGFTSPQHNLLPDVSHNVDVSWEQRLPGSDVSFKLTPYYRGTMGQFENILLDNNGNQSGVNVGSERSLGVEFALQKGNFTSDGVSALLSVTYNHSRFRYAKFASGFNVLDLINQKINSYNAYTSACAAGGSAAGSVQFGTPLCGSTSANGPAAACYNAGVPDPACAAGDSLNPYWNRKPQPLFDPNGAYFPYDVIPDQPLQAGNGFGVPLAVSLVAQFKHARFTATPSIAYSSGSSYGAPLSTVGDDPASPGNTIPIPNDFSGVFDNMGAFKQPWRMSGNLKLGFAATPRTQLTLQMANIFDICHQRGYAWDRASFCNYTTLPFGQAPNSSTHVSAAGDPNYMFPYTVQNGNNNTQFLGTKIPFQAYFGVQVKL